MMLDDGILDNIVDFRYFSSQFDTFRYFSSMSDSRMISVSILAVFAHALVNLAEYCYVSETSFAC